MKWLTMAVEAHGEKPALLKRINNLAAALKIDPGDARINLRAASKRIAELEAKNAELEGKVGR